HDGRVVSSSSSLDGWMWDRDAAYEYERHGPMRRIEYGLDSVQGADYAYTLNGWLKGINIPSLNHDLDPGHDGDAGDGNNRTFARDAFGSYDILNRLMGDSIFNDAATGEWTTAGLNWSTRYAYDPNGNITALKRYDGAGTDFDMLGYSYASGTNKLDYINDTNAVTGTHPNDIEDQDPANYTYDLIGNLTADAKENITSISWTPSNKIDSIVKTDSRITYAYDAAGNRVRARVYSATNVLQKTTWYVRDASGTVLSIYEQIESGTIKLKEVPLYGSDRVGMIKPNLAWSSTAKDTIDAVFHRNAKERSYELKDHLGNVRAVVSDEVTLATGGEYLPNVLSRTDYYPYGMAMETRTEQQSGYRYGFNGKENDNDVKGAGGQQDYGFRMYDPRVARFISVDPLTMSFPSWTPYAFAMNRVVDNIDLDGLEGISYLEHLKSKQSGLSISTKRVVEYEVHVAVSDDPDMYPQAYTNDEFDKMAESVVRRYNMNQYKDEAGYAVEYRLKISKYDAASRTPEEVGGDLRYKSKAITNDDQTLLSGLPTGQKYRSYRGGALSIGEQKMSGGDLSGGSTPNMTKNVSRVSRSSGWPVGFAEAHEIMHQILMNAGLTARSSGMTNDGDELGGFMDNGGNGNEGLSKPSHETLMKVVPRVDDKTVED
ncbi:MAG: RHS repeat-associated core domain-containing protein, partial [bacterium]|nr:RHS repeat-associated core domain-containing protein [bacterium]